tara:strand:+ start:470 stop:613 length:144 start_codon:yes stop_codon:yes gene_type:complete
MCLGFLFKISTTEKEFAFDELNDTVVVRIEDDDDVDDDGTTTTTTTA